MVMTVTEVLNQMNEAGVFSYVIPFLLIFAVVFALLQKTGILGDKENKGIHAVVGIAVGLLALQFDIVSTFFSVIFPRMGVGLSVFLVLLIFIGFFFNGKDKKDKPLINKLQWIGYLVGIGVAVWALTSWGEMGYGGSYFLDFEFGWWLREYFWSLIILGGLIGLIVWVVNGGKDNKEE